MELWCVKDNPKQKQIKFECQTLYNLRLKKHYNETVKRDHILPYQNIWAHFGLKKQDLLRCELHLVAHLYLKMLFLNLPTMDLNKGDEEDSDTSEKAMISVKHIDVVTFVRRII